jgi:hypothetical protein
MIGITCLTHRLTVSNCFSAIKHIGGTKALLLYHQRPIFSPSALGLLGRIEFDFDGKHRHQTQGQPSAQSEILCDDNIEHRGCIPAGRYVLSGTAYNYGCTWKSGTISFDRHGMGIRLV